jgi:type I restriction enzyme, S subunit
MNSDVKLGDLLEIKYGKNHKNLADGIIPVYGSGGIMRYVNEFLYDGESILIPRKGTLNNLFYVSGRFWTVDTIFWSKINTEKVFGKFLFYYLTTFDFSSMNVGTAVPSMTSAILNDINIKLPCIDNQKKIAHILSTLDDKIELNRKMNQTLEEMASAIFKSWFVDFDPVHAKANCEGEAELENIAKELGISKAILDLFPSEFEESELGMIPKGWKIINFKDLVEKYIDNRGKTPPLVENGISLLEVRTLPNEMLSSEYLTDKCVSDEIYNTWFRSHLETDDILISTVGTIGLTSIVPPNSKFVIAQNVLGIRANEEFILKKFMFYLMKSKFFIDAINARLVTTVQSSIKRKDMETINILVPNFDIQKEFVKFATPIIEKMQSNEILNLQKTRDTLLPKLLSGEIDVSALEIK